MPAGRLNNLLSFRSPLMELIITPTFMAALMLAMFYAWIEGKE